MTGTEIIMGTLFGCLALQEAGMIRSDQITVISTTIPFTIQKTIAQILRFMQGIPTSTTMPS